MIKYKVNIYQPILIATLHGKYNKHFYKCNIVAFIKMFIITQLKSSG